MNQHVQPSARASGAPPLETARFAAAMRSLERAEAAALRLSFALSSVRASSITSPTLESPVSGVLDEFVGSARTVAEICSHSTGQMDGRARVERTLSQLGRLYCSQDAEVAAGRLPPSRFMLEADELVAEAQGGLHSLHADFERVSQAERPATGDHPRQLH